MKKQKSTRLKKPKKVKKKQNEIGIKKGLRSNSCNDLLPLSNSRLFKKKLKDAEDEAFYFKASLYYAALTLEGFPEITKKILWDHKIEEEEMDIIGRLARSDGQVFEFEKIK